MERLLLEFKEYATEIDVKFVRKSIAAIGQVTSSCLLWFVLIALGLILASVASH
jgi:vesicle coat complex subunit